LPITDHPVERKSPARIDRDRHLSDKHQAGSPKRRCAGASADLRRLSGGGRGTSPLPDRPATERERWARHAKTQPLR